MTVDGTLKRYFIFQTKNTQKEKSNLRKMSLQIVLLIDSVVLGDIDKTHFIFTYFMFSLGSLKDVTVS